MPPKFLLVLFRTFIPSGLIAGLPLIIAADERLDLLSLQTVSREWSQLKVEAARLESDWQWQKLLMETTQLALQEEATQLQEELKQLENKLGTGRDEVESLEDQNLILEGYLENLAKAQVQLTEQLLLVRGSLPPRLSESLELAYRSIADEVLAPGERMQFVITIVSRCFQFNKSVTLHEEVLDLGNSGEESLVEVLYWGLSHAYALDRQAGKAYLGQPGEGNWTWELKPGLEDSVETIIAVFTDELEPQFLNMPLALRNSNSGQSK